MPEFSSFWQWLGWFLILCVVAKVVVTLFAIWFVPKGAEKVIKEFNSDD